MAEQSETTNLAAALPIPGIDRPFRAGAYAGTVLVHYTDGQSIREPAYWVEPGVLNVTVSGEINYG